MVNGVTRHQSVKVHTYPEIFTVYSLMLVMVTFNLFFTEIRCPEPIYAEHGILSVTGNDRMYGRTLIRTGTPENSNTGATSYKIGALAKYRCERGYKVVGEPLSTCEENGKWSGEVPRCVCKKLEKNLLFKRLRNVQSKYLICLRFFQMSIVVNQSTYNTEDTL